MTVEIEVGILVPVILLGWLGIIAWNNRKKNKKKK